jgi:hypothetical protein
MTRFRLLGFLGLLLFVNLFALAAEPDFIIDKSKLRIEFADTAHLRLPITSRLTKATSIRVNLEFLTASDMVVLDIAQNVEVRPGDSVLEIALPGFLELEGATMPNYDWLRLRYALPEQTEGIVSVSRIAPEPFVLKLLSQYRLSGDSRYRIQVVAQNPRQGTPVSGIAVSGTLELDLDPKPKMFRATAKTDKTQRRRTRPVTPPWIFNCPRYRQAPMQR